MTVGVALAQAASRLDRSGSETARLDAEVLLAWVLGVDRTALLAHPEAPLGSGQAERYEEALERRDRGEPVAYIRGMKEFYGSVISVDGRVLVPRPETEALVELALERITNDLTMVVRPRDAAAYLVWDIGTGSGAIPVALANELRRRRYGDAVRFLLSDISSEALEVALINAVSHGLADGMSFAQGDLVDVSPPRSGPVDLLLANLPYIPSATMASLPRSVGFEPEAALDGGTDGLDVIGRLLPHLPNALRPAGSALLEFGSDQEDPLLALVAATLPQWDVSIHPDLSGSARVVSLQAPA